MPRVRITKKAAIAEDGIHVRKYNEGWQGEVTERALQLLISIESAVIVRERTSPETTNPKEGTGTIEPKEKKDVVDIKETEVPCAMRVYELSDEIGVSSSKIVEIAKSIGIDVKVAMSGLTLEEANKIKSELEKPK